MTDLSDLFDLDPPPHPQGGDSTISERDLADLIGVSESRVRGLTADGVLSRVAPATYDRRAAVRAYCASLREVATRSGGTRGNPTPENAALKAETLKIAKQKAIKLEIENKAKKAELIPVADVKRAWTTLAIDLRTAIMAIPARLTTQLSLDRETQATIEMEIRAALEEIAENEN
jgi:phage terminase Nu1 subunit (DNA packaging protein)